jgi:hypothetical protein
MDKAKKPFAIKSNTTKIISNSELVLGKNPSRNDKGAILESPIILVSACNLKTIFINKAKPKRSSAATKA